MRLIAALAILLAPQAALAGTRATYVDDQQKRIVIEVADNGDARITPEGSEQYGILRGGELYAIGRDEGKVEVARIVDVAAALDQVMPPVFKQIFSAAGKAARPSKMRIEPKGSRRVGGRGGFAYAVYGMDSEKPNEPAEIVVSKDPALRPVGRAMEEFMIGSTLMMASFIGPAAADMAADMRAVFALGAPLDMAGKMKLVELGSADIPHEATELPAKPRTVDELVAGMKKDLAGQAAEAEPAESVSPEKGQATDGMEEPEPTSDP
ncbi:MAG TPA: hypothetical protein VGW34_08570 [Allosphingosinicella sp.]|nr:hypothetical protein [Allosphingosinicella sp.]